MKPYGFVQPPILRVGDKTTIYQKLYKPLHPNPNDFLDQILPVRFYAVRVDDLSRMVVRTPWRSGRLVQPVTWWQLIRHWFQEFLNSIGHHWCPPTFEQSTKDLIHGSTSTD